jgi:hypothetical protein
MAGLFQPKRVQVPGLLSDEGLSVALKNLSDTTKAGAEAAPPNTSAIDAANQITTEALKPQPTVKTAAPRVPGVELSAGAEPTAAAPTDNRIGFGGTVTGFDVGKAIVQAGTLTPEQGEADRAERAAQAGAEAEVATGELADKTKLLSADEREAIGLPPLTPEDTMRLSSSIAQEQQIVKDKAERAKFIAEGPLPTQTEWLNIAQVSTRSAIQMGVGTLRYPADIWDTLAAIEKGSDEIKKSEVSLYLDNVDKALTAMMPGDKTRSKDFTTKLAAGAGSMVGFMVTGWAGRAVGLPAWLTTGTLGAAVEGDSLYQEADTFGATATQKLIALFAGSGLGLTEAVPIDRAFMRADTASGGMIRNLLANTTSTSLEEFIQEASQSLGEDIIAKYGAGYDPKREISVDKALENGLIGAIVGGTVGGATTLLSNGQPVEQLTQDEAKITETVDAALAEEQQRFASIIGDEAVDGQGEMAASAQGASGEAPAGSQAAPTGPDPVRGDAVQQIVENQAAFHGTPHKFDKFSMEKIGTGEGAQAFGHGLYFAGNRKVAENYRETLSQASAIKDNADPRVRAALAVASVGEAQARANFASTIARFDPGERSRVRAEEALQALDSGSYSEIELPKGALYQVDIPDDAELLDWDVPLNKQSPDVLAKLKTIPGVSELLTKLSAEDDQLLRDLGETVPEGGGGLPAMSGSEFYYKLGSLLTGQPDRITLDRGMGQDKAASEALLAAGIPGLRYLDAGSRGKADGWTIKEITDANGETRYQPVDPNGNTDAAYAFREDAEKFVERQQRTRNYVIFDDSRITITDVEAQVANPIAAVQLEPTETAPLPGTSTSPNPDVVKAARAYTAAAGLPTRRQRDFAQPNPARSNRIAQAYADMKHEPADPAVLSSYQALVEEVQAQYVFASAAGDLPPAENVPVYPPDHPLAAVADQFWALHRFFGQGLEGASDPENMWQAHARLFSADALPAFTAETRGAAAFTERWGEPAERKVGQLPSWTWQEGVDDTTAYAVSAPVENGGDFTEGMRDAVDAAQVGFYFEEGGCWGMALALNRAQGGVLWVNEERRAVHAYNVVAGQAYDWEGATKLPDAAVPVTEAELYEVAARNGVDEGQVDADAADAAGIIENARSSGVAERFHDAVQAAVSASPYGAVTKVYSPAKYAKMRTFLSPDGSSGFALDGEKIVSLFGASPTQLRKIVDTAIANGGRTFEGFDTGLPEMMASLGFRETGRKPWVDAYAPKDWPAALGKPDMVSMEWSGDIEQTVAFDAQAEQRERFRRYMSQRTFSTREDAERVLRYYIDKWNEPGMLGTKPEQLSYDLIDEILVKRGKGFAISNKGLKPKAAFEASEEPIGEAPDVAWGALDTQDYRRDAKPGEVVDELFVSFASIPKAKLAGGRTDYDWTELERGGAIPPVTLRRNKNGSVSIIDGNHRIEFFRERGFDSIPAYVIRAADAASISDSPDIDRMTGTATARNPYLAEPTRPTRGIPTPSPDPGNQEDVRLSAISRNFVTILGLTARHGRLAARDSSVMGEYNRRTAAIRLRTWTDFSTLVHEGGHALNDSMAAPLNAFVQRNSGEINKASKLYAGDLSNATPETVRREGFAEFFRAYVTNPSFAQNRWPTMTADFETTLRANDPKILDGLNSISAQFAAWVQLPSRQLIRNMVVDGRRESGIDAAVKELRDQGFKGWMSEYARRATGVMINKYVSVAELEAQLLNLGEANRGAPIELQRSESPTAILRLARNSGSRAQVQITDGVIGYRSTQSTSRGLREALMTALGIPPDTTPASLDQALMKDFDAYLVARRAFDEYRRFEAGEIERPPIGAQKGDVVRTIKEYEQSQPQFAPAAAIVHEYGMAMWQKRYDAGLMDKETYEEGLQRQFYAPLQRDVSDKQGTGADSIGFGSSVLTKGPRFRGSDRDIISPMTVLMQMTFALEKQIAENDAKRALAVLADRAGQAGALVERIPASQLIGQSFSVQQVAARLTADSGLTAADASDLMTILAGSIEKGDLMTLFRSEQAGTQGENVIFFWENGKIAAIRLNDSSLASDVVNTMNAVGRENMDVMLEAVAATSTVFRTAITSWPDFLLVNYIRDQFSAWILGGTNYVPFATGFQGITDEIRQKQWAKSYNAAGGTLGGMTVASLHRARVDRDINALRAKGYTANVFGDANGGWSNVPGVIKAIGRYTALTETGTRLGLYRGAYERAIKDGLSEYDASVEAAYIATDYIDFGLNGSKMLTARRLIPFLNAQLQGLYKMVRTLGGDEVARRKGLGFALGAYFKNINNLPLSRLEQQQLRTGRAAWLKMMSLGLIGAALWAVFRDDPDYQEAGEYLRTTGWVIPTGDGKIFYIPKPFELALISNAVERGLELATGDTTAIDRFKRGVAFALTPPTAPPAIQSIVEVAANYDFFTGREIVPSYSQALAPQLQYDNYTSSIAKWVGGATGQSPLVVDHILSGMGASAYRDISTMLNAADPSRPMPDETELPILRRFVRDVRKGSASAQDFWAQASNTSGKLERAKATYKQYQEMGNEPAANRFLDSLPADERAYAVLMTDFKPEEKRLNPFYRARQVTSIVSGMRRENASELGLGDTTREALPGEGPLTFQLARGLRTQVDDILSEIARREVRNTLIATGQPGWQDKEVLPLEPTLDMLLAISPDAYDEYNRRRVKAKVYDAQAVYDYWPEVRDRLVSDGPDAVLSDAVAVAGVVF